MISETWHNIIARTRLVCGNAPYFVYTGYPKNGIPNFMHPLVQIVLVKGRIAYAIGKGIKFSIKSS